MKILFLTNGLGLGNSTRCHAIMQRLRARGAELEVVTSENGLWYFSDKPEVAAIHEVESLAYGSKDGAISIGRTLGSAFGMIATLGRNLKKLARVLDQVCPDAVVTDSDYNFIPVKRRGIPLIALNNADVVWHSYFRFSDRPATVRPQFYAVEMLDYRFHRMVPDLVISPCLDAGLSESGGNVRRTGPIVREGYNESPYNEQPRKAAVMLSGSVFGTPINFCRPSYPVGIDVIGRVQPDNWTGNESVAFHGKIKNTAPLLRAADLAVVNGGFSAVSEMFWMRKPLVVVPVPRHAEQWVNARTIEHLGLGLMATQETYEKVMLKALDKIDDFRDTYKKLAAMEDGAKQAAQAILDLAAKGRP